MFVTLGMCMCDRSTMNMYMILITTILITENKDGLQKHTQRHRRQRCFDIVVVDVVIHFDDVQ